MTKILRSIVIAAAALVAVITLGGYILYSHETDLDGKLVTIIIKPGTTMHQVANELADKGVVSSAVVTRLAARYSGVDRKLTPGRYDFGGSNSPKSVLKRLADADFVRIKVTIPEGNTIWKTASELAADLKLDSATIVNLGSDSAFLDRNRVPSLEGYLFPETYYFPWGTSAEDAVSEMITMYHEKTDKIWPQTIDGGLSRDDVIKLASIIEAETGRSDERAVVSSVYHNRLRKNMKLDADPTVIYGLGGLDRPLYRKDLSRDTPYNTYLHKGLPPTPINSPGLAAIQAALNPEQTDYLFFVADENGRHYFSRTNAEQNRAIRRIKRARRSGP
jgi:UPF0755 protein